MVTSRKLRTVLFSIPVAILLLMLGSDPLRAQGPLPNFIVIMADDLGYADLGVYGATDIDTPHLDQMAAEGIRFTSFYSQSSVCTPTRASLLTGRHSMRVNLDRIIPFQGNGSDDGLADYEITLAEALKSQGYATGIVGKWHLGHLPEYNPVHHGFDSFFGIPYSNDYNDGDVPLMRDETVIEFPVDQTFLTQRYTEEAIDFINTNADQPFFLYLPHTFPHVPLHVSPAFEGQSERGLYGDVVQEIDWSTGEILAELQRLGLEDNTLVAFFSDNGPWIAEGENGGSAGTLRCGKGTSFEGGVRVPGIFRWPGMIPPGQVTDRHVVTTDLFATLLGLAGVDLPADRVMDSQDIRGVLFGTGERADDEIPFTFNYEIQALRAGKWKFHRPYDGGQPWMDTCGQEPHPLYLFDLASDPGETHDLSALYPEIVAYLQGELIAFGNSLAQPTNQPPIANFTFDTPNSDDDLTFSFSGLASMDIDSGITSYSWNFGDGNTSSGVTITHTYEGPGVYSVTLVVTDSEGLTDGVITEVAAWSERFIYLPMVMNSPPGTIKPSNLARQPGSGPW